MALGHPVRLDFFTQPQPGEVAIHRAGTAFLALNFDSGRPMPQLYAVGRLVDLLSARSGSSRKMLDQVGIMAHPLEYHSPKLPGLGDVNWGQFFSVLGDAGYQGPVCVEVEDRTYEESLSSRRASLAQSADYLRQFVTKRRD